MSFANYNHQTGNFQYNTGLLSVDWFISSACSGYVCLQLFSCEGGEVRYLRIAMIIFNLLWRLWKNSLEVINEGLLFQGAIKNILLNQLFNSQQRSPCTNIYEPVIWKSGWISARFCELLSTDKMSLSSRFTSQNAMMCFTMPVYIW